MRKLLGHCSLSALRRWDLPQLQQEEALDWYVETVAGALRQTEKSARATVPGNSYGESAYELALSLLYELQVQTSCWHAFVAACAREYASGAALHEQAEAGLRKKVNDMFVVLRDKVDADNYLVASGRDCSPNKMYTYRMLDTAYHALAALFANWRQHEEQVAAILGRPDGALGGAEPIEVRQMKTIAGCKGEWLVRWSATLERFSGAPGPLHTRSKRFSSLKNNPAGIGAMLAEIGDYEELSANLDSALDWRGDAGEAALWLDDYWRVRGESEHGNSSGPDLILPAPQDESEAQSDEEDEPPEPCDAEVTAPQAAREQAAATAFSLPPRFMQLARAAQDGRSWAVKVLSGDTLGVRLAVYQKLLGGADDSYPDAWRDPATGALPTLQQLAALDGVSMPTLRKRRNDAIARLQAANRRVTELKESE